MGRFIITITVVIMNRVILIKIILIIMMMIRTILYMTILGVVPFLKNMTFPGDVGPLRFSDLAVPNGCGLCCGLHGPIDCGGCCVSRGEAGVAPFWPDDEELDGYVDEVVLLRSPMGRLTLLFVPSS